MIELGLAHTILFFLKKSLCWLKGIFLIRVPYGGLTSIPNDSWGKVASWLVSPFILVSGFITSSDFIILFLSLAYFLWQWWAGLLLYLLLILFNLLSSSSALSLDYSCYLEMVASLCSFLTWRACAEYLGWVWGVKALKVFWKMGALICENRC